jgi:hypothetical protein
MRLAPGWNRSMDPGGGDRPFSSEQETGDPNDQQRSEDCQRRAGKEWWKTEE